MEVQQMLQTAWSDENRKLTVCIDSYEDGVLKGYILNAHQRIAVFESLVQFLLEMEAILEDQQMPQSYTSLRRFFDLLPEGEGNAASFVSVRKGIKATFELQILFRQHSSWQGIVVWKDRNTEQSFRSVLELVFLLDSALRDLEGSVAS